MTKQDKCMVVLSGGQDSTICLFWAKQHFEEVHAITFDYGQKHRRECNSAKAISLLAGIDPRNHLLVGIDEVFQCTAHPNDGGEYVALESVSPLTNKDTNLEQYENYEQMQKVIGTRVEKTFVPMRNAFFLVLAANRAVARGIRHLVTGVCEADGANYPDCREFFIKVMQGAIREGLGDQQFYIHTPLISVTKSRSIRMALQMPGCYHALAYSHTAYDGSYPPTGKDHASVLRAHGFEEAGVPDPLVLRAMMEGLMSPPDWYNNHGTVQAYHGENHDEYLKRVESYYRSWING